MATSIVCRQRPIRAHITNAFSRPMLSHEPETRKCWGLGGLCWPISGLDMAVKYDRPPGDQHATDALWSRGVQAGVCTSRIARCECRYPAQDAMGSLIISRLTSG